MNRKNIVITGSSRGIGYHMAQYFLGQGHRVLISGSSLESTEKAFDQLKEIYTDRVVMKSCDVTNYEAMKQLGDFAISVFDEIDIWINNAGVSHQSLPAHELNADMIKKVVDVNVLGVTYGSKVAVTVFTQQGFGALYNMEGLGSDGRVIPGQSIYAASKRFLRHYTRTLTKESKGKGYIVGRLSPGMVTTDLLMKDIDSSDNPEKAKKIFSILADRVTTVAPWLGQRILSNDKNGQLIAWLTTPKIIYRFMTASLIKRNPF